eukprot:503381_1
MNHYYIATIVLAIIINVVLIIPVQSCTITYEKNTFAVDNRTHAQWLRNDHLSVNCSRILADRIPKNQTAGLNEYWDNNRERYLKALIHEIRSVYPTAIITAEGIIGEDIQTITIKQKPIQGILKHRSRHTTHHTSDTTARRRLSEQKSDTIPANNILYSNMIVLIVILMFAASFFVFVR